MQTFSAANDRPVEQARDIARRMHSHRAEDLLGMKLDFYPQEIKHVLSQMTLRNLR